MRARPLGKSIALIFILAGIFGFRFLWMWWHYVRMDGLAYFLSVTEMARVLWARLWALQGGFYAADGYFLPFYFWVYGLMMRVCPDVLMAPVAANAVFSTAGVGLLFLISRRLLDSDWEAAAAAAFGGFQYYGIVLATGGSSDPLFHMLALAAGYFFLRYHAGGDRDFLAVSFFLTLSCGVRYEGWMLGALWSGYLVFFSRHRRVPKIVVPALCVLWSVPALWMCYAKTHFGEFLYFLSFMTEYPGGRESPVWFGTGLAGRFLDFFSTLNAHTGGMWLPVFALALVFGISQSSSQMRVWLAAVASWLAILMAVSIRMFITLDLHLWWPAFLLSPALIWLLREFGRKLPSRGLRGLLWASFLILFVSSQSDSVAGIRRFYGYRLLRDPDTVSLGWKIKRGVEGGLFRPGEKIMVQTRHGENLQRGLGWTQLLVLYSGRERVVLDRDLRLEGPFIRPEEGLEKYPSLLDGDARSIRNHLRGRNVRLIVAYRAVPELRRLGWMEISFRTYRLWVHPSDWTMRSYWRSAG